MPMRLYYRNYFESGTVEVTSENSSYPKYRLYDRAQGLLFKGTNIPEGFIIKVDLGESQFYPEIDTFILGKNHNLMGLTLILAYSEDGINYDNAIQWVCTSGINLKKFTKIGRRYWGLWILNPSSIPEVGELFLTKEYVFEQNPDWGYDYGDKKNIERIESQSGFSQKTKYGEKRKRRSYRLTKMNDAQRIDLETFEEAIDGVKNFYIEDMEGNIFFAELPEGLPDFKSEPMGRWSIDLNVLEVLD